MAFVNTLASVGMACGPPLVYLDQYINIVRKRDSTGFSMDVCGVLIVANIVRVFFWFGKKFEMALLVQSILMITFQLALLYVCLKYRRSALPTTAEQGSKTSANAATSLLDNFGARALPRPWNLWQWEAYGSYLEFIAAVIGLNTVLYLLLGSFETYVDAIGLVALGLESTLPIPQLLSNYRRKSLAGFRMTVLAGWLFGDAFKTVYFFVQSGNSWQFKATACFQLSVDCLILGQAYLYRHNTAAELLQPIADEDLSGPVRESIEIR